MKANRRPVPYDTVSPGYEAVYTGEESAKHIQEDGWPISRFTDDEGKIIEQWSVWTWTPQNREEAWGEQIRYINKMQAALGPLDDETRRLRAHIGSLVLCEPGIPVTIDELLNAIGRGYLWEQPFHNGCWCCSMWWDSQGTQPRHTEIMQTIEDCLTSYLEGISLENLIERFPHAEGFLRRAFDWLGPVNSLSEIQELLIKRMLLPFEIFTRRNLDTNAVYKNCFEDGGRGQQLDTEISRKAGLPKIYPDYRLEFRENLQSIPEPEKQELYRICCSIAHGLHELSDCHHSMYRWIENWIHEIGTGKWEIATRKSGTERERLARLLFGYTLGLDKWLMGNPMQFLLLDLGHLDLGFDPKNEILRVYAYLGEGKTPVKEWLAACLWHNLSGGGNPRGWVIQQPLNERAKQLGISTHEWMDSTMGKDTGSR